MYINEVKAAPRVRQPINSVVKLPDIRDKQTITEPTPTGHTQHLSTQVSAQHIRPGKERENSQVYRNRDNVSTKLIKNRVSSNKQSNRSLPYRSNNASSHRQSEAPSRMSNSQKNIAATTSHPTTSMSTNDEVIIG